MKRAKAAIKHTYENESATHWRLTASVSMFGTNYVNNCSFFCHQASGVGLASSLGTVRLDDLDHTDLYLLSDGGIKRFEGPRSEVSILATIGQRLFADDKRIDWHALESHSANRLTMASSWAHWVPPLHQLIRISGFAKNDRILGAKAGA